MPTPPPVLEIGHYIRVAARNITLPDIFCTWVCVHVWVLGRGTCTCTCVCLHSNTHTCTCSPFCMCGYWGEVQYMHIHVCLHGNTHTCTCSPCVPTQHSTCLVEEGTPYNCHTNEFLRNPGQRERDSVGNQC